MTTRLRSGELLTFDVQHESWHWAANRGVGGRPTIYVSAENPDGGCVWQFAVVERDQRDAGGRKAVRIEVFDEAFAAFREIPEFFAALDAMPATNLADVVTILRRMDGDDVTEREMPPHIAAQARPYRVR